jgi:MFS transporter, FHS family, glucose/mannose:H+ symporter
MKQDRLLWGCALALFMAGAIGAAPGAVIPQWEEELGSQTAWYFSLFLVGAIGGTFWASRMKVRHPWLVVGLLAEALGLLLVALAPEFAWISLAAVLLSLGVAVANFHTNALPLELYGAQGTAILIRVNAAFAVGAVVSPLLMVALPWRLAYAMLAGVALLAAWLLWKAPAPKPTVQAGGSASPWWLVAAVLAYVAVEVVIASFSGVYLRSLGYGVGLVGVLLALYWACIAAGRLVLGGFVAVNPLQRLWWLHAVALLVALVYVSPQTAWAFPLIGFLVGPSFPTFYTFAQKNLSYRRVAYLFYAGALGGTLVPAAFALLDKALIAPGIAATLLLMVGATYILSKNQGMAR